MQEKEEETTAASPILRAVTLSQYLRHNFLLLVPPERERERETAVTMICYSPPRAKAGRLVHPPPSFRSVDVASLRGIAQKRRHSCWFPSIFFVAAPPPTIFKDSANGTRKHSRKRIQRVAIFVQESFWKLFFSSLHRTKQVFFRVCEFFLSCSFNWNQVYVDTKLAGSHSTVVQNSKLKFMCPLLAFFF